MKRSSAARAGASDVRSGPRLVDGRWSVSARPTPRRGRQCRRAARGRPGAAHSPGGRAMRSPGRRRWARGRGRRRSRPPGRRRMGPGKQPIEVRLQHLVDVEHRVASPALQHVELPRDPVEHRADEAVVDLGGHVERADVEGTPAAPRTRRGWSALARRLRPSCRAASHGRAGEGCRRRTPVVGAPATPTRRRRGRRLRPEGASRCRSRCRCSSVRRGRLSRRRCDWWRGR